MKDNGIAPLRVQEKAVPQEKEDTPDMEEPPSNPEAPEHYQFKDEMDAINDI